MMKPREIGNKKDSPHPILPTLVNWHQWYQSTSVSASLIHYLPRELLARTYFHFIGCCWAERKKKHRLEDGWFSEKNKDRLPDTK